MANNSARMLYCSCSEGELNFTAMENENEQLPAASTAVTPSTVDESFADMMHLTASHMSVVTTGAQELEIKSSDCPSVTRFILVQLKLPSGRKPPETLNTCF